MCVKFVCAQVCVYVCGVCSLHVYVMNVHCFQCVNSLCSNDACVTSSERLRQHSPEKDDSDSGTH